MTVHRMQPLSIADSRVFVVQVAGLVYVPLRTFVTETLGMTWQGQRWRLAGLRHRWHPRQLAVEPAGGRISHQPCLPAQRMEPYLWLLRPHHADARKRLARLQDGWNDALARHYHPPAGQDFNGAARIAALEAQIARLAEENAALRANPNPTLASTGRAPLTTAEFLRMHELAAAGWDKARIGRALGCSRTLVSLFLAGRYTHTAAGREAAALLAQNRPAHPSRRFDTPPP